MKTILAIAVIIVVLGAGYALARPTANSFWNTMMNGPGYGMMNAGMMSGSGHGNGMIGGPGACVGYTGNGNDTNATPITIEKAKEAAEQYLISTGNTDLAISEVIEFDNNFYAVAREKSTDMNAFELLVNKYNGKVFPEMGPNMMWNTKYGHMTWNTQAQTTITKEQALKNAQSYLEKTIPGTKVGDVDAFYGYYTIEVTKDDKIYGMLSVNENTGAVWYHTWHGRFVKILE